MEHISLFKFLGLEIKERRNAQELPVEQRNYAVLSLLDSNNNPCKFFIFKIEIIEELLKRDLVSLDEVNLKYEVVFINNMWNVRLVGINE